MAYIKKLNSDVFSLQEVTEKIASEIVDALNAGSRKPRYAFVWDRRNQTKKVEDGEAIIYRKDILIERTRVLIPYENKTHCIQAVLFETISSGREFWIVNTHVDWSTRERDLLFLMKQVNDDTTWFKTKTTNIPKIIMGDFNATADEEWYKELAAHDLQDAYKVAKKEWPAFSYHSGKQSKYIDFFLLHRFIKSSLIACIFYGNNQAEPVDLKTINGLPNSEIPSDHLPVTIQLILYQ